MEKMISSHGNVNRFGDYKVRFGPDGLYLFNRMTGTNILFDEASIPNILWSKAPRQVSIALTNTCDLSCTHCYAPKHRAILDFDLLKEWLLDLDENGSVGVGLGGGEPTLYPRFNELCEFITNKTNLALTMTTHGHRTTSRILETISKHVNFVRVSMDGIDSTYENIRGKSFNEFVEGVKKLREIVSLGVNFVVNKNTIGDLPKAAKLSEELGASEFLLLPEVAVGRGSRAAPCTLQSMQEWIHNYHGKMRLSISENHSQGLNTCEPFKKESGAHAYVHIDASGKLKLSSFDKEGVLIGKDFIMSSFKVLSSTAGEQNK